MKERWKRIRFFPDYEVSTRGRVRSWKSGKPKLMKPQPVNRGDRKKSYLRVGLRNKGGSKNRRVHRLVALAFIPRIAGKNTVNHKNGNTFDNRMTNLEWTTRSENTKHAWRTGLMKNSVGARWRTKPKRKKRRKPCRLKTTRSPTKRCSRVSVIQRSFCR